MEKNAQDQLDRLCAKCVSNAQSQGGKEYLAYRKKEGRMAVLETHCVGSAF